MVYSTVAKWHLFHAEGTLFISLY